MLARSGCGPLPDAVSTRSRLIGLRRLLASERDCAHHQAGERRDLEDGSGPAGQRLAEQHEPGRRFGPFVERRFFATGKGPQRRAWAEHSLQRFGVQVIIVCRFIPGGRTAVTLTCGLIRYQRRRFLIATAAAAVIWAL